MEGEGRDRPRRILVFGWGAAAQRVLAELAACSAGVRAEVLCLSHTSQAGDCDLREVCASLGFAVSLTDSDDEVLEAARAFGPDLIVSASYRKRIRGPVLDLARECINFHPSLLPRHRGCWSGFWTIFEGDEETGVTCHRMVEEFDKGRILHQERCAVSPDDTSASIYTKILPVTAACARSIFEMYFRAALPEGEEQQGPASYHFRRLPYEGLIQPEWSDVQVDRYIRAMHFPPFDGAAVLMPSGERVLVESLGHYQSLRRTASDARCESSPGS